MIQGGKAIRAVEQILFLALHAVDSSPLPCAFVLALVACAILALGLRSGLVFLASSLSLSLGTGMARQPGTVSALLSCSALSWNKSPSWITADVLIPRDTTLNIRMSKPGAFAIRYCQRGNKKGVWLI